MSDFFTADLNTTPLLQAIPKMEEALRVRVLEACRVTADTAVREMKNRLARQLSSKATGKTVAGIHSKLAYDGDGYVILSDRGAVAGETEPIANLPLWLEKGTRVGRRKNFARTPAKPFFYASLALESGPHERRIRQAMHDAAAESGLGD